MLIAAQRNSSQLLWKLAASRPVSVNCSCVLQPPGMGSPIPCVGASYWKGLVAAWAGPPVPLASAAIAFPVAAGAVVAAAVGAAWLVVDWAAAGVARTAARAIAHPKS